MDWSFYALAVMVFHRAGGLNPALLLEGGLEELRDVRSIFFCGSASSVAMALTWLLSC